MIVVSASEQMIFNFSFFFVIGRQDIIINSQVLPNDNLDQSKGMTKKSERLSNIRTKHIKLTLPIDKDIKQPD